jgi:acyl-CoA synthetase (NDP forming)/GNAT superfamily N-acetyltransferase
VRPEPGRYEVPVLLADGTIAHIRRVRSEDADRLITLHAASSDTSIYHRFFALNRRLGEDYVRRLCAEPELGNRALLAEIGGEVVALATAEPVAGDTSEVAFLVADGLQGKGIGTLLLEHLASAQRQLGVTQFVAEVMADNSGMLRVFHNAGFVIRERRDHGTVRLEMDTAATDAAVSAADARERAAEARSLRPLLRPRAVAVVGAGRSRGGVGREVLENIRDAGYVGDLYAINPHVRDIDGLPCYPSVTDIPAHIDLAVVAVPASLAVSVIAQAAEAGVGAAVVLTAGFEEASSDGAIAQAEMLRMARDSSMRLIGPNCLGVLNNDPTVRLNATFASISCWPGGFAFASQSGGVGIAVLDAARDAGLGVSSFVSLGNKADVSGNDLIAAWTDDETVRAAALYLESFGNPLKFARLARRLTERKPLLAVIGGSSAGGRRAGASHTAAAAAPSAAVEALFAQSGVIGVPGVPEMVGTARMLLDQPLPAGPRVAVLGNAGGMGVIAADAAHRIGLVVPEASPDLLDRLWAGLPSAASVINPVDLGAAATPQAFETAVRELLDSTETDSLLTVVAVTRVGKQEAILAAVDAAVDHVPYKPVALVILGAELTPKSVGGRRIPVYASVEDGLSALSHAAWYADWRRAPRGSVTEADHGHVEAGRELVRSMLDRQPDGGWLSVDAASSLLAEYGVQLVHSVLCSTSGAAVEAADEVGYPVVVKVADPNIVHKTDRGLVVSDLRSAPDVRAAVDRICRTLADDDASVLVQRQATGGVELAVGVVRDATFGPLVMVAAGGVATDVWGDQTFLIPPVTDLDATRAIRSLRIWPLLAGHRGSPACDVDGLGRLVQAVAALAVDQPEIAELDLNPVIVTDDDLALVDVKMLIRPASATPPLRRNDRAPDLPALDRPR